MAFIKRILKKYWDDRMNKLDISECFGLGGNGLIDSMDRRTACMEKILDEYEEEYP